MTREQAREVVEYMGLEHPFTEAEVYEDYSGRCMYGEKTDGVVTDNLAETEDIMEQLGMDPEDFSVDSMGLSAIIY